MLACATRGGGRSDAGHCFHLLLAQAALRAPPEVAFTMRSWPLLAQFGNYFVVLGPLMEQNLTFVLHISSPRIRSKAKDSEKKRDRTMVITMASYALQMPPRVAHAKPPGPKEESW